MIRLRRPDAATVLDERTRSYLSRKAATASAYPPGDPRIANDWASFLNTKSRTAVESALDAYSRSKCAYCEQVAAKDIEHFYPKTSYPARMFSWENFLRGCKNCNNAKLARFPLDAAGQPLLIDPCAEEPLDYFAWDRLTGATGLTTDAARRPRALGTRDLFDLDQEPLREERRIKIQEVLFLLSRVVQEDPIDQETKDRLREHLLPHRPWLGPIRELIKRPPPEVLPLIDAAIAKLPEIRGWFADWL